MTTDYNNKTTTAILGAQELVPGMLVKVYTEIDERLMWSQKPATQANQKVKWPELYYNNTDEMLDEQGNHEPVVLRNAVGRIDLNDYLLVLNIFETQTNLGQVNLTQVDLAKTDKSHVVVKLLLNDKPIYVYCCINTERCCYMRTKFVWVKNHYGYD